MVVEEIVSGQVVVQGGHLLPGRDVRNQGYGTGDNGIAGGGALGCVAPPYPPPGTGFLVFYSQLPTVCDSLLVLFQCLFHHVGVVEDIAGIVVLVGNETVVAFFLRVEFLQ